MKKLLQKIFMFFSRVLLSPRVKSLAWHCLAMLGAAVSQEILDSLNLLELSPQATVILGLVLAQLTKALNNHVSGRPAGFISQ